MHVSCFNKWLRGGVNQQSCIQCRHPYPQNEEEQEQERGRGEVEGPGLDEIVIPFEIRQRGLGGGGGGEGGQGGQISSVVCRD